MDFTDLYVDVAYFKAFHCGHEEVEEKRGYVGQGPLSGTLNDFAMCYHISSAQ